MVHVRNYHPVLYTGGTFDLLHPGHIYFLRRCRDHVGPKGKVIVALNTDEFVARYKGIICTHDFEARRTMLEALDIVDLVVKNVGGEDSRTSIEVIMPSVIAIGEDWKERDYHAQMGFTAEWLRERRIDLQYFPLLLKSGSEVFSSTGIRRALSHKP